MFAESQPVAAAAGASRTDLLSMMKKRDAAAAALPPAPGAAAGDACDERQSFGSPPVGAAASLKRKKPPSPLMPNCKFDEATAAAAADDAVALVAEPVDGSEKIVDFSVLKALRVPKRVQNPAEIIRRVSPDSKEFKTEIERQIRRSFLCKDQERLFRIKEAYMIENCSLNEEYKTRKAEMRDAAASDAADADALQPADEAGQSAAAASAAPTEQFAFLAVGTEAEARVIAERGVAKGNLPDSRLAAGDCGVSLCQYVDRTCPARGLQPVGWLLVLRYLRRRVCRWVEGDSVAEPQPQFDCHVSLRARHDGLAQLPLAAAFHSSQVFLFEYSEDYELADRPRQVLPVAAVRYEFAGRIVAARRSSPPAPPQQQLQPPLHQTAAEQQQQQQKSAGGGTEHRRHHGHHHKASSGPGRLPFVASRPGGGSIVGRISLGLNLPDLDSLCLDLVSLESQPFVFPCLQQGAGHLQVHLLEFHHLLAGLSGCRVRSSRESTCGGGGGDPSSGHVSYLVGLAPPEFTHPLARLCNQLSLSRRALLCSLTSTSSGLADRLPLCYLVPSNSRPAERLGLDRLARKLADPGRHQLHALVWLPLPRTGCFFGDGTPGPGDYWAAECRSERRACYEAYADVAGRVGHLARQAAEQRRDLQARSGQPGLAYRPLTEPPQSPIPQQPPLSPTPATDADADADDEDDDDEDEDDDRGGGSNAPSLPEIESPPAAATPLQPLSLPSMTMEAESRPPTSTVFEEPPESPDSGDGEMPASYHNNLLLDLPVLPTTSALAVPAAPAASVSAGGKRRLHPNSDSSDGDNQQRPQKHRQLHQQHQFMNQLRDQITSIRSSIERQRHQHATTLEAASPASPTPPPSTNSAVPSSAAVCLPTPETVIAAASAASAAASAATATSAPLVAVLPSPMSPSPPPPPPLNPTQPLPDAPASPSPPAPSSPAAAAASEAVDEASDVADDKNEEEGELDVGGVEPALEEGEKVGDNASGRQDAMYWYWYYHTTASARACGDVDERWCQRPPPPHGTPSQQSPQQPASPSTPAGHRDVDMRRMPSRLASPAPAAAAAAATAADSSGTGAPAVNDRCRPAGQRRVNPLPHPSSLLPSRPTTPSTGTTAALPPGQRPPPPPFGYHLQPHRPRAPVGSLAAGGAFRFRSDIAGGPRGGGSGSSRGSRGGRSISGRRSYGRF